MENAELQSGLRLEGLASVVVNVTLFLGIGFCLLLFGLFLYSCFHDHQVSHLFDPELSVSFGAPAEPASATSPSSYFLRISGWRVQLTTVEPISAPAVAIQLGWLILQPGLALAILALVRSILKSVLAGEPFHDKAPVRVKAIGFLIIAGVLGRAGHTFLVALYVRHHYALSTGGFDVSMDFNGLCSGIGIGFLVLILAHVFGHGRRLRQEQELTI